MTIARSIARPIASPIASRTPIIGGGGGGGPAFDFYVDSVNGSDANDGLTAATAKQSLAAVASLAASNQSIVIKKGSTWRDKLNLTGKTGNTVSVLGTGSVPIIECTDIASGWTQPDAVTYPNVWYLPNWISELNTSQFRLTAYENGKELPNVTSLALVNATAGRSFITTSPDGDDAIYIHATGSGDPNTNGSVYTVSKRVSGIHTATNGNVNLTITGPIIVRNAPWLSGGVVSAIGATFNRVNVRDSARGSFLTSGTVEDSIYSGGSTRTNAGTSNQLVFFTSTAGTYTGTVRRCGFVAGDNPDQAYGEDISGLFSHNDQPGVLHDCMAEQCWFHAIASLGGFRATSPVHVGPYAKNAGSFNLQAGSVTKPKIQYGLFNGGVATSQLSSWDVVHRFEHTVSYDAKMLRTGDGFEVQNCVWFKSGNQNALTSPSGGGVPNLSVNNSICITSDWAYAVDISGLTSYTGNNNIFASFFTGRQARFRYNGIDTASAGTDQHKLKRWQDLSGQDANSVYILPADQTIGGANALFLGWSNASSGTRNDHGPALGDFRINPNARVYSGADVAYIGEFPDGTPLVGNVGPQFHWDWNARAVASGPPTSWPDVPETEVEQTQYISDPEAWNFYP
jgi:hypothetical protein